jgi:hypothetical protein
MGNTWVVDFSHFLDEHGDVVPLPETAHPLFEQLTAIIVMASHLDSDASPEYQIFCRRRPNRKPCTGVIQADLDPETDNIVWWCPVCKDTGVISNWQGTMWDMSDAGIEH